MIDYLREIKPQRAIAIHDAGLSAAGNAIVDGIINSAMPAQPPDTYGCLPVRR